ncbi:MAG: ATP synthase F0 subunit B [Polyangiaceae bacterium]|nr:ATP synthase F0 subunit B [Polyangiaceae bacterium]
MLENAFFRAAPLLSGGGIEVDISPTLMLIQFGILSMLVVVLKPLLFDPLLAVLEEREKRVDGARAEARKMDDEAAELLLKYDGEIQKVHRVAVEERDKVRAAAQKLEAAEMSEARAEAQAIVERGRAHLASERERMLGELAAGEADLSQKIAGRVLGRELS